MTIHVPKELRNQRTALKAARSEIERLETRVDELQIELREAYLEHYDGWACDPDEREHEFVCYCGRTDLHHPHVGHVPDLIACLRCYTQPEGE